MACVDDGIAREVRSHAPTGRERPAGDLHGRADTLAAASVDQVVGWRHDIHQHPELSNREERTAGLVGDHLRSLGLEVRTGIAGHGVVGILRGGLSSDRVVALRADIDALPVKEEGNLPFRSTVVDEDYPGGPFPVAHACGHDGHTAMLLGAASVLSELRSDLAGTVMFVFQPAEEGPPLEESGGAAAMVAAGAFDDPAPSMVFGMHLVPLPVGVVGYRAGNSYAAVVVVRVTITGRQVHGSTPWMGIDPMPVAADIVVQSAQIYRQLPAYDPLTVTFGHVQDVGRFNIIGDTVTLMGTIRASVEADMKEACDRLRRIATSLAEAHGCTAEVEFLQSVPAVHNTPAWVETSLPTLERVVGHDGLLEATPTLGYDDVSEFVNRYGGLYVMLGCQDIEIADGGLRAIAGGRGIWFNHNPRFYVDDAALPVGVRLHCHVAIDHPAGNLQPDT